MEINIYFLFNNIDNNFQDLFLGINHDMYFSVYKMTLKHLKLTENCLIQKCLLNFEHNASP